MNKIKNLSRATLGTALAAALAAGVTLAAPTRVLAQPTSIAPANDVTLSVGTGRMIRLDGAMSDLFVANDAVADVQVRSANQLYVFGKTAGTTSVYATNKAGKVVYSANIRVGTNLDSVGGMLRLAMPEAQIHVTPLNGLVLLTGTVKAPEDVEEANRLVQAFVGTTTQVVSRLRTATPLQVMLKVRIAEVSRSLVKEVGVNLLSRDTSGGFLFGIGQGNPGTITNTTNPVTGAITGALSTFANKPGATTLGFAGHLLGIDLLSTIDLHENDGLVTTLAEPTLTALSGETASFLAGGEFPIPIAQGLDAISIEYKPYGVGLAFTPTVLSDGRISMRVRPEVSEISDANSVKLNGYQVPALTTRRAETTVELGSGQSFMIAGLLSNSHGNSTDKAPWLGDLPVIGALFRSNSFKRNETELVIIVTPYLVKPVEDAQIALPTDGLRSADDPNRVFLDQRHDGRSGEQRPGPVLAPPQTVAPGIGSAGTASVQPQLPAAPQQAQLTGAAPSASAAATPGFNLQ
jgi:pilus assembly protein CpaC